LPFTRRIDGYRHLPLVTGGDRPLFRNSRFREWGRVMSLCDKRTEPTTTTLRESGYRALWGAAVLQAKADVEQQPIGSIDYDYAVAFFVGGGAWAESRAALADCLDVHPDDIERVGRRCIAARRKLEGLPPKTRRGPQQRSPLSVAEPSAVPRTMNVMADLN